MNRIMPSDTADYAGGCAGRLDAFSSPGSAVAAGWCWHRIMARDRLNHHFLHELSDDVDHEQSRVC